MKRLHKKGIYLMLALTLLASCTGEFEEINNNPNGPIEVPATLMIPGIVENLSDRLYSTFVGGDMGNCWAQHWAKVQYNDEARYQPRGSVLNAIWTEFYAEVLKDAQKMEELAVKEQNNNLLAVAKILKAYTFLTLTDMFGDVPYEEALQGETGNNSPAYSTQEKIYSDMLVLLDEANDLLSEEGGEISATSDILYDGDPNKWKKFANSLKFRALMRISNRGDFGRAAELQDLIDNRLLFMSNEDEAKLQYLESNPNTNPVYNSITAGNRGEFKVCEKIISELTALNDPRLEVYAQPNEESGVILGKPAGIKDVPNDVYNYTTVSSIGELYIAEPSAPAYLLSYSELEFLIAEAAERGLISGQSALEHYRSGIQANLLANGIDQLTIGEFLSSESYTSTDLSSIHRQKWIALFGQGVEAWTEWRRTGIPNLTVAIDAIGINEIPSRYTYPPSEQSLNNSNYTAVIARQGEDKLTTKIWWMK